MPYVTDWVTVGGRKKLRVWHRKADGGRGRKVGDFAGRGAFDRYRKYAERAKHARGGGK